MKSLIVLFGLSIFFLSTNAQTTVSGNGNGGSYNGASSTETLTFTVTNASHFISAQLQAFNSKTKTYKFLRELFTTDPWPRFRFSRLQASQGVVDGYGFGIGCHRLIEFEDNGTVAGHLDKNDTVLQTFKLWTTLGLLTPWSVMNFQSTTGSTGIVYSASTSMSIGASGSIEFKVWTANNNGTYQIADLLGRSVSVRLAPFFHKWAVLITNFPFTTETSLLAMKCFLHSVTLAGATVGNASATFSNHPETQLVDKNANNGAGIFAWEMQYDSGSSGTTQVTVTSQGPFDDNGDIVTDDQLAITTILNAESSTIFEGLTEVHRWHYFVFNQSNSIHWDPTTAYDETDNASSSDSSVLVFSLLLLIVSLISTLL